MRAGVAALAVLVACAPTPAPYPSVLVLVDTDLPVPRLASHLRVDVFDVRGLWLQSRTFSLRAPSSLPASFSVFLEQEGGHGEADDLPLSSVGASVVAHSPPRLVVLRSFAIDREEVSVRRMRAALARGLTLTSAMTENDGPLATTSSDSRASCTYRASSDPSDAERDDLPVTCVSYENARAYCQFFGGDLPTEAQWEYAATVAGRPQKTRYPWGESEATCAGVVFARMDAPTLGGTECHDAGFPFGARGASRASLDVTPDGVRGLAGVVFEWVRGAPLAYDSACFLRAGLVDPSCEAETGSHVVRGGDYGAPASGLVAVSRTRTPSTSARRWGARASYGETISLAAATQYSPKRPA